MADETQRKWVRPLVGAIAGGSAVAATPAVLSCAGFTSAGIAVGSLAATIQGHAVAHGGLFALCQSIGANGLVGTKIWTTIAGTAAVGGLIGQKANGKIDADEHKSPMFSSMGMLLPSFTSTVERNGPPYTDWTPFLVAEFLRTVLESHQNESNPLLGHLDGEELHRLGYDQQFLESVCDNRAVHVSLKLSLVWLEICGEILDAETSCIKLVSSYYEILTEKTRHEIYILVHALSTMKAEARPIYVSWDPERTRSFFSDIGILNPHPETYNGLIGPVLYLMQYVPVIRNVFLPDTHDQHMFRVKIKNFIDY